MDSLRNIEESRPRVSGAPEGEPAGKNNEYLKELQIKVVDRALPDARKTRSPRTKPGRRGKRYQRFRPPSPQQQPPAEYPAYHGYQNGPLFSVQSMHSSPPGNHRGVVSVRSALVTVLVVLVVGWVSKQINTYKREAANLSLLRSEQQQLISYVDLNRSKMEETETLQELADEERNTPPEAGVLVPSVSNQDVEAEEDAWNTEIVTNLVATQRRLRELQEKFEEQSPQKSGHEAEFIKAGGVQVSEMGPEEALLEKLGLEEEVEQLKEWRRYLEGIVNMQEEIERDEMLVENSAAKVISLGSSLGKLNTQYKNLVALEHIFSQSGDFEKLAEVTRLKSRMKDAFEIAKQACSWAPGLTELSLLVEKDNLRDELLATRKKLERQSQETHEGTSYLKVLASGTLQGPAQLLESIMGLFRGGMRHHDSEIGTAQDKAESVQAERESERREEQQTIENLKKELSDVEAYYAHEKQVLNRMHSYDGEKFIAWLARKSMQARTATERVTASLRSLPAAIPSELRPTQEAQKMYSTALSTSLSKAVIVLEHAEQ